MADNSDYEHYDDILQSLLGVILFGVPNEGIRFEELIDMVEGKRSEAFVLGLLPDNDTEMSDILSALNRDFGRCFEQFKRRKRDGINILCYYETDPTRTSNVSLAVVAKWRYTDLFIGEYL